MLATTRVRASLARLPLSFNFTSSLSRTTIPSRQFSSSLLINFRNTSTNNSSQSTPQQPSRQFVEGLRQKNVPLPGNNEDADSAISGFMNMFNDKESRTVSISSCTKHGFVTTEAISLQGPVLCIGGQVFLWDIYKESGAVAQSLKKEESSSTSTHPRSIFETMDENTAKEIFKVFELMNPRPEILIIGTGKMFAPLSPAVRSVIRSLGLQVDMMSTANAAATYNMLAEEGREVAAALLPLEPSTVQIIHGSQ
ncbi:hypothetical protein BGZ46_006581 [Entomortierella lignicola]|nr:hypothetical protein BGZ46_006581 [Entomortierella lignicola]